MTTAVKTHIIKIGNSQGIRIPKVLLQQVGLHHEVEVEAQSGQLVIRPIAAARQGWDQAFQAMAMQSDDHLLDPEPLVLTEWETSEWEW
ncbi:MAG: AbrB/MazE/SpoVT family DNA-binding domain-containing protein [Caldilinea sp. CFX5]|nr:AbrB/MazE/SpoVT family DNA-binding domain-containing protein [Caldilinea sp. CFX5]